MKSRITILITFTLMLSISPFMIEFPHAKIKFFYDENSMSETAEISWGYTSIRFTDSGILLFYPQFRYEDKNNIVTRGIRTLHQKAFNLDEKQMMQYRSMEKHFFNSYNDKKGKERFRPKKGYNPVFSILPTYKKKEKGERKAYRDKIIYFGTSEKYWVKVKVPLNGISIIRNGSVISIGNVDVPIHRLRNADAKILFTVLDIYSKSLKLYRDSKYSCLTGNEKETQMQSLKSIVSDRYRPYYVHNGYKYHITEEMYNLIRRI
jgi:hypothetical protein